MAYTAIDDPTQYFNTVLYTGNGANGHGITGVGFQPDWVWLKSRANTESHWVGDSVRGANLRLQPNESNAEFDTTSNSYPGVSAFDSDGFTVGRSDAANANNQSMVAWNWRAGGSASSNTTGSIDSSVSANTDAGFSIVTYTGTGSNATVGHGLGSSGRFTMLLKNRSISRNWAVFHPELETTESLRIDVNGAKLTGRTGDWNSTAPTSTVFSVGTEPATNGSGNNMVAYVFREIKGYSKFGSYTGNGTGSFGPFAGGTFVYTGFKPAWLMIKRTDGANGWTIFDSVRDPFNIVGNQLSADSNSAEEGDASHHAERDFLANGFKLKGNGNDVNADGANYVYMAFAEQPFVSSNGVPTTAR